MEFHHFWEEWQVSNSGYLLCGTGEMPCFHFCSVYLAIHTVLAACWYWDVAGMGVACICCAMGFLFPVTSKEVKG